jgi:hypothetical protein
MRYIVELDAGGQRSETIREGDSPRDAARACLGAWHTSARLDKSESPGTDLGGQYIRFTARVGRSIGSIRVRDIARKGN